MKTYLKTSLHEHIIKTHKIILKSHIKLITIVKSIS
jgi:hypothetical protein